jgi:plasmid maintenance system antidote protein VapI
MTEEQHHLGDKIRSEMKRLGKLNKDLAAHFSMASSSVTEMLQTGRLAKEKYQRLVDLNGRSLDWWFDIAPTQAEVRFSVAEPAPEDQTPPWVNEIPTGVPPAPYNVSAPQTTHNEELLQLFNTLPRAEQQRFLDELRQKAAFYKAALQELLERQQATASH